MTDSSEMLLDINSLLAGEWSQLQHLLAGCYPCESSGAIAPSEIAGMLERMTYNVELSLIANLQKCLSDNDALDANSYSLAAFVDHLFNNYHKNNKLHPDIQQSLDVFRPAVLLSLCRQQLPWKDKSCTIRYLQFLLPSVCGWQPELGRAAEKFMQNFQPLLVELADSTADHSNAVTELKRFIDQENQRVSKLEQRIKDAEIGQLHAKHAQQLSAKTLNQQMAGKKLPSAIARFLQGPWRESMRLIILSQGKDSDSWRKIVRLTETLIWSFQPIGGDEPEEKRQHIYQSISELSEELRETAVGLHHSSELDNQLAQVEAEHLKILKGQELSYEPFNLLDNTDPLINAQVSISKSLLKNVAQYDIGQWFIQHTDDTEKRIKLTIKIDQAQQLLFTNFLGIKSAQFNFEEFAYMLSSKIIVPLSSRDRFKATAEKMLQSLLQRYQLQQQTVATEKAIEEEIIRQQEIAREVAREKALEEAKAHAKAAAEARKKSELAAAAAQQEQKRQQRSKSFAEQLDGLQLGGRVSFISEGNEEQLCRLAAILQSSGEYIFVDRAGIKQHTLTRQQLTDYLIDGRARIIDQGSNFENTLEQVVNNLRARKKP